ncbi:amidase [Saccharibacillus sp. O23]|uniref:amidase n=1 Tax=Saccharibacillus sp. O23 TaxID=2009338 RepID=UPI000B4E2826|nr:amidase [Saccharibacillus sp. O23]OWR31560.1 amidase [Saccharibacillus sp. O23]
MDFPNKSAQNRSAEDRLGAYVDPGIRLPAIGEGVLNGLKFAVKDVFDLQGVTSGAGNPDWLKTHAAAESTAPALVRLLENGATLQGTTHTDELMYSLNGQNAHYGTPVNPAAPERIPGGSSSGSAVAAAAGLVDFAVGTDTGGSVRIPSSYCGLYGFRPTHGAVSAEGVIPLARSFDTVGWMSRDPEVLLRVGEALLEPQPSAQASGFKRLFMAREAWELLEAGDRSALLAALRGSTAEQAPEERAELRLTESGETLADWSAAFRVLQGTEIAREHGEWIDRANPAFGPGIAERFAWARTLEAQGSEAEEALRARVRRVLVERLGEDGLLALPTAPGPAPLLGLGGEEAEAYRAKVMQLSCIAGLSGLPQVTVPIGREDGLPIGLSFIGGPGSDLKLLRWASEHFADQKEVQA